jgi:hypothetical protein
MYSPETGRGYDGITSHSEMNRNSGAESTIEALLTLCAIANDPVAEEYFRYRTVETPDERFRMYEGPEGDRLAVGMDGPGGKPDILEGDAFDALFGPE